MESEPEVVEQESRPLPRWLWAALAVVLLVGAAAWVVDERQRGHEGTAIDHCRSRLRAADDFASARLMSMADYIRPTLSSVPPEQARDLGRMMQPRAVVAIPRVQAAARACQAVPLWHWHGAEQARLAATTAYADALVAHLELISAEGLEYFRPDRRLDRLRARADLS